MVKSAIITGATSGIGMATANVFSKLGMPLVITGRREERLKRIIDDNKHINTQIYSFTGDITQENMVSELLDFSIKDCKLTPNVYILSAGHGLRGTILESDSSKWNKLLEVNYLSAIHQLRMVAKLFIKQAQNANNLFVQDIVVIGSTVGRIVSAVNPVYGSTKFALHSLVESLRQEVCSYNIRVTLIEPGFVNTEFQEVAEYEQEWFKDICKDFGPILEPDDIARTINFVISQPTHVHLDDIRIRPTKQKV